MISNLISNWTSSAFGQVVRQPWEVTNQASLLVASALESLSDEYIFKGDVAIHRTAIVEAGSSVKGPAIVGPNVFVGAGALLRGGVFLDKGCIVGHSCEVKSSIMFEDSKIAHLSFIGDSIIGCRVNIEAGAIIANYRNEMQDKRIRFVWQDQIIETDVDKFGALIGDDVRIGANAVVAPGAILEAGLILSRLGKIDQHPGIPSRIGQ